MKKAFGMILSVACAAAFLTGCGKKTTGSIIEDIKAKGEITVYTNPEFPPYEYVAEGGKIVGAEIDIVNKVAEKLGVKANCVSAEFDSIIGTVTTGKADLGASGFTINEERKKTVSFSNPFVVSIQYLILPENSPFKTIEDLAGKKIGGQNGTTGFLMVEDAVKDTGILAKTGTEAISYNTAPDAVVAMKAGRVEAVVIDELVAKSLAAKNPGYKAIPMVKKDGQGLDAPEEFGLIVKKGNEELIEIVNGVIDEMKADGSLEKTILHHQDITSFGDK